MTTQPPEAGTSSAPGADTPVLSSSASGSTWESRMVDILSRLADADAITGRDIALWERVHAELVGAR